MFLRPQLLQRPARRRQRHRQRRTRRRQRRRRLLHPDPAVAPARGAAGRRAGGDEPAAARQQLPAARRRQRRPPTESYAAAVTPRRAGGGQHLDPAAGHRADSSPRCSISCSVTCSRFYRHRVERALGSGVIVDSRRPHHHQQPRDRQCRYHHGDAGGRPRDAPATVVGRDPDTDLALLSIKLKNLPVMPLGPLR